MRVTPRFPTQQNRELYWPEPKSSADEVFGAHTSLSPIATTLQTWRHLGFVPKAAVLCHAATGWKGIKSAVLSRQIKPTTPPIRACPAASQATRRTHARVRRVLARSPASRARSRCRCHCMRHFRDHRPAANWSCHLFRSYSGHRLNGGRDCGRVNRRRY